MIANTLLLRGRRDSVVRSSSGAMLTEAGLFATTDSRREVSASIFVWLSTDIKLRMFWRLRNLCCQDSNIYVHLHACYMYLAIYRACRFCQPVTGRPNLSKKDMMPLWRVVSSGLGSHLFGYCPAFGGRLITELWTPMASASHMALPVAGASEEACIISMPPRSYWPIIR